MLDAIHLGGSQQEHMLHLCACVFVCSVGVTLNCEKLVKMLTALQRRQQHKAGVLGTPGGHGGPGATGLLLEGGGRQPGSQCDVLVCARGGEGRLQVRAEGDMEPHVKGVCYVCITSPTVIIQTLV